MLSHYDIRHVANLSQWNCRLYVISGYFVQLRYTNKDLNTLKQEQNGPYFADDRMKLFL